MTCVCSLAGTSACASCFYNPNGTRQANNFTTWNTSAEMSYKDALILLDELGLSERMCRFIIKDNMNETEGMGDVWIECSACHCKFDYYADDWLMKMSYCPNCGAKVVDE